MVACVEIVPLCDPTVKDMDSKQWAKPIWRREPVVSTKMFSLTLFPLEDILIITITDHALLPCLLLHVETKPKRARLNHGNETLNLVVLRFVLSSDLIHVMSRYIVVSYSCYGSQASDNVWIGFL